MIDLKMISNPLRKIVLPKPLVKKYHSHLMKGQMSVKVNHAGPDDANGRILPLSQYFDPKQTAKWLVRATKRRFYR